MCRTHEHIKNSGLWCWEGNRIEPDTVVKRRRRVAGANTLCNIDIREFITSDDNKIIKREIEKICKRLPAAHKSKFISRKEGSFDFRVDVIKEYFKKHIAYQELSGDYPGLYPEETITLKKGDCEDVAFLMASLMLSSGISKYVVRVAFGRIIDISDQSEYDHVWVMYKNENGVWQLIEPMSYCLHSGRDGLSLDDEVSYGKEYLYKPGYVMNCDHLWSVNSAGSTKNFPAYIEHRSFWKGSYPKFIYKIHKEIVNSAIDADDFKTFLKENNLQNQLLTLDSFKNTSPADCLNQFAYQVSNVDVSLTYEPRLHFDNAFIKESFVMMEENMKLKTLRGLAKAFHALGDMYSHTSFPAFAKKKNTGALELFEVYDSYSSAYKDQFDPQPYYDSGIFDLKNFSNNSNLYILNDNKAIAINYWKDKIISGRFGQSNDSQGIMEHFQLWPKILSESPMQGALPHHNEIAVDSPKFDKRKHKLYKNTSDYNKSYESRKKAAIEHISKKYNEWKSLF